MLLGSIYANAYDIELNGLYYSYINEGRELEFDSCNAGTQVLVIPDEVTYHDRSRNVTAVGANACNKDSSIISIAIPNTVTKIGNNAFARTSIQTLIIPSSVVSIGDFAFSGCKSLVSVQFGSNVKTIGDLAFFYCTGLTKVTLPVNLETRQRGLRKLHGADRDRHTKRKHCQAVRGAECKKTHYRS